MCIKEVWWKFTWIIIIIIMQFIGRASIEPQKSKHADQAYGAIEMAHLAAPTSSICGPQLSKSNITRGSTI